MADMESPAPAGGPGGAEKTRSVAARYGFHSASIGAGGQEIADLYNLAHTLSELLAEIAPDQRTAEAHDAARRVAGRLVAKSFSAFKHAGGDDVALRTGARATLKGLGLGKERWAA